MRSGKPILVGEAGPELFIPSQSGRIDPNGSEAPAAGWIPKTWLAAVAQTPCRVLESRWMAGSSGASRCVTSPSRWLNSAVAAKSTKGIR